MIANIVTTKLSSNLFLKDSRNRSGLNRSCFCFAKPYNIHFFTKPVELTG